MPVIVNSSILFFHIGDGSLTGANLFRQEWHDLVKELLSGGEITKEEAVECGNIQVNFIFV